MRKTNFHYLLLFAIILLNSCQKDVKVTESTELYSNQKNDQALVDSLALIDICHNIADSKRNTLKSGIYYTDWSGKITFEIVRTGSTWSQHIDQLTCAVDPDYVCVGGGCSVYPMDQGYGAYITESRPFFDLRGWIASSKDHLRVNYHYLEMFAIGMKIEGVSKQTLLGYLRVKSTTSPLTLHTPAASTFVDPGYSIIGGGAGIKYNGAGILLTQNSAINTNSPAYWFASGKDHKTTDSGTITSYLIEISNESIPGFGRIQTDIISGVSQAKTGRAYAQLNCTPGYSGITCVGGSSSYSGYGRYFMEFDFVTDIFHIEVSTKDHINTDYGKAWAQLITAYKKP